MSVVLKNGKPKTMVVVVRMIDNEKVLEVLASSPSRGFSYLLKADIRWINKNIKYFNFLVP